MTSPARKNPKPSSQSLGVGVRITYSVDASDAERAINKLADNLSKHSLDRFLHDPVAVWLQHRAEGRFGMEGDEVVGKWQPLKLATLLIRARKGFPTAPINVRTGQMKAFVTGSWGNVYTAPGGMELVWPNVGNMAMSGTLAVKIMTAQMGKISPPTVARPVLAVGELDNIFIVGELTSHLMRGL